ncbi:DUF6448 family protein [Geoalkalibacter sp.]|uniref:DUF6448 family protein n=1 Tax=Geoalkalibacter sp. TaxID=3041440 RepID=UPI00272E0506|nr:DUF6448 family protein [Geoalkalibacter sp.]
MKTTARKMTVVLVCVLALVVPQMAFAHCDALDGPVINEARQALDKGEITPVLKWVSAESEDEVRAAFAHTLKVRALGDEARELADLYFFETLVRVHRAGEGAPYTGIKPAGTIDAPIMKADQALENGSVDALADAISAHVGKAMRERFTHALELREKADESVDAGREYVEAYVQYVHFVEGIVGVVHGDHAH